MHVYSLELLISHPSHLDAHVCRRPEMSRLSSAVAPMTLCPQSRRRRPQPPTRRPSRSHRLLAPNRVVVGRRRRRRHRVRRIIFSAPPLSDFRVHTHMYVRVCICVRAIY